MSRAPTGPAWRRIAAWGVDWLIISLYAVALVPLGRLLVERSVRLSPMEWNAVSFGILVVPATVWLAAWEAGERGRAAGQRALKWCPSAPPLRSHQD